VNMCSIDKYMQRIVGQRGGSGIKKQLEQPACVVTGSQRWDYFKLKEYHSCSGLEWVLPNPEGG